LLFALWLGVAACGGRVNGPSTGDAGAPPGNPTNNGSDDNFQTPCPLLVPPVGDSCTFPAGRVCAYVGGGLPCQAVECDDTGHWVSTTDGC
jgi:hypothetical protein